MSEVAFDYECAGPLRRKGEGNDHVYDHFEELKPEGMQRRASEVAWSILQRHNSLVGDYWSEYRVRFGRTPFSEFVDDFFDYSPDRERVAKRQDSLASYGFRESDEQDLKERSNEFRIAVKEALIRIIGKVVGKEMPDTYRISGMLVENHEEEEVRNKIVFEIERRIREGMEAHKSEDIAQMPLKGVVVRIERYFAKKRELYAEIKRLQEEKEAAGEAGERDRAVEIDSHLSRLRSELPEQLQAAREPLRSLDKRVCKWVEKWRRANLDVDFEESVFERNWHGAMEIFKQYGLEELVAVINSDARSVNGGKKMHESWLVAKMMSYFSRPFVPAAIASKASRTRMIRKLRKMGFDFTYARERELIGDDQATTENHERVLSDVEEIGALEKPHRNMSLKLTSIGLATFEGEIDELTQMPQVNKQLMKDRLKEIVHKAKENDVFVRIDMEHFIFKDVTFEIFLEVLEELAEEDPSSCGHLGMVFQAYLNESPEDADKIIERADDLCQKYGIKVRLRVVKGANRGKDKKLQENGLHQYLERTWHGRDRTADSTKWDGFQKVSPIFGAEKENGDGIVDVGGQFVDIMRKFERAENIVADYGTHNPNTIAQIKAEWLNLGRMPDERQIQFLMGVDNPLKFVLHELGFNQRVYVPFEQIELVAEYLWRRFMEYLGESTKPSIERRGGENGSGEWGQVNSPEVQAI